jgi:hypothetical protein
MDFRALESLSSRDENIMHYRIELSRTRRGFARVQLPGRELTVEAKGRAGPDWEVLLTDLAGALPGTVDSGTVEVRADDDNDAVWLVARAAIRAVSELTGNPIEDEISADPVQSHSDLL